MRAFPCLALPFVTLAMGACGVQAWSFDGDAAVDTEDADLRQDANASGDESALRAEASGDDAVVEAASDAPSAPDVVTACLVDGDCPDDTPVCRLPASLAGRVCTGCGADADCSRAARPVCDTSSGRCVACTSDVQCSSPTPRCDLAAHSCVRCLSSADCGRESFCSLPTHACTPMF